VKHTKREANCAAHGLAKHAVRNQPEKIWIEEIPSYSFYIINLEFQALSVYSFHLKCYFLRNEMLSIFKKKKKKGYILSIWSNFKKKYDNVNMVYKKDYTSKILCSISICGVYYTDNIII
jgi:FMN phosphatase YigB (HAD superfamily)